MTDSSDALIDRRRLKRRLARWRALAVIVAAALGIAVFVRFAPLSGQTHVAIVAVDGLILDDPYLIEAIEALAEDDSAAAVIVHVDSPGGTTFASESLYRALRAVAEEKPVVAVMDAVAASGGYMAAIAADHIVARETTITGSIGVILEATNFVGLMETLGIENESIRSGPLKARPNPFERLTPEARAATQRLIDQIHAMFVDMVAERRGLTRARTAALADGRVFTGGAALEHGLIDQLGGDSQARDWLAENHDIGRNLPTVGLEIDRPLPFGPSVIRMLFGKPFLTEPLMLDGLVSVWHPSLSFED